MKTGLAIAIRREQIGLSQEELGNKVGVSKATISRWESGDISNMRRDRIQRLADALKISPLLLLQEEVDEAFMDIQKEATGDDARSRIIDYVDQLSAPQEDRLLAYLEGVLSESQTESQGSR